MRPQNLEVILDGGRVVRGGNRHMEGRALVVGQREGHSDDVNNGTAAS